MTGPNAYFDPTDKPFIFADKESNNMKPPIPISKLTLDSNTETAMLFCRTEVPNWWWRMWQYLLLGFKWEKLNKGE